MLSSYLWVGMLTIKLLGGFEITLDGKPVALSRRHIRLLAFLLLNPGRHSRINVAEAFWPDEGEVRLSNLRHNIYMLRHALGESDKHQVRLIGSDDIRFQVQPEDCIDVLLFDHVDPSQTELSILINLANSFGTPDQLIIDFFPEQRLEQIIKQHDRVLARIAECFLEQSDIANAILWVDRRIQHDPTHEDAYIAKMQVLAEAGLEEAIVAVADSYEHNTQTRVSARLRRECVRLTEKASKKAEQGLLPSHNLPHFDGALVGRTRELKWIVDRLQRTDHPIITIAGMGGMGKTRLAVEAASRVLRKFQDGVYFVNTTYTSDLTTLAIQIAQSMGFRFFGGAPPEQQLIDRLRGKCVLLILDAAEHALENSEDRQVVTWLDQLVDAADQISIIATSRERLLSPHEVVLDLSGLSVPEDLDEAHATDADAVKLFLRLAERRLGEDMPLHDVAHICRLVQGMPLAIEMAASWVRVRTCREIAAGIQDALDLSSRVEHPAPIRQYASLRASFDYSWQQLDPAERLLFMKLGAFESSCSPEAAKQVANASGGSLLALADKSFIRREASGYFAMHELLRQYGREKFKDPAYTLDIESTQQRLIDYFADFAEIQHAAHSVGYDRFELEWINLLAVIHLAHARAAWEYVIRLVRALTDAWDYRARYGDALKGHGLAIGAAKAVGNRPMLLRSLRWQGRMLLEQGHYVEANAHYETALGMALDEEDEVEIAFIKYQQAWAKLEQGELEPCQSLLEESIKILEEYGHTAKLPEIFNFLARLHLQQGNPNAAAAAAERSRAIQEPIGPSSYLAHAYKWLSEAAQDVKDWDKAREYCEHALSISQQVNDAFAVTSCQYVLARIHTQTGQDLSTGLVLAEQACRSFHKLGVKKSEVYAKGLTGQLHRRLGHRQKALDILAQCLRELEIMGDTYACVNYRMHLGDAMKDMGDQDAACTQWQVALAAAMQQSHPLVSDLRTRLSGCR